MKLLMLWVRGLDRSIRRQRAAGIQRPQPPGPRKGNNTEASRAGNWWHFRGASLLTIVLKPDSPAQKSPHGTEINISGLLNGEGELLSILAWKEENKKESMEGSEIRSPKRAPKVKIK